MTNSLYSSIKGSNLITLDYIPLSVISIDVHLDLQIQNYITCFDRLEIFHRLVNFHVYFHVNYHVTIQLSSL